MHESREKKREVERGKKETERIRERGVLQDENIFRFFRLARKGSRVFFTISAHDDQTWAFYIPLIVGYRFLLYILSIRRLNYCPRETIIFHYQIPDFFKDLIASIILLIKRIYRKSRSLYRIPTCA